MPTFTRSRRCWLPTLALGLLATAGCGSPTGTVSGTVTFRKAQLGFGTVQLFTEEGQVFSCLIDETGSYCLRDVPTGPARLTVATHPDVPPGLLVGSPPGPPPGPSERRDPRRFVPIPERYALPDQSGLTMTVVAGRQNFDIELDP